MEAELKTMKSESTAEKGKVECAMMCWELTSDFSKEQTHKNQRRWRRNPPKSWENQKHEEEHVGPTLDTGSRIKISIEEFSWEREADRSTLETEEPDQQEVVYITNLKDGLQNIGTKLYDEEDPNEKKPLAINRLIEEHSLNNLYHVFEMYEESGSDVDYLEDSLKVENKRNLKEDNYTNMDEEKEGKQADLLRSKITRYDHYIPKKEKMRKFWSQRKWSCHTLERTFS